MRKSFSKIALAATLGIALAFTFSCSSGGGGGDGGGPIKKEKISGVAQKGPFAEGAKVIIRELNASFEKTNNSFEGETDAKGRFEIEIAGGTLASPYIILEASGKYANEVSGEPLDGPITLNAIADVSGKSKANINVLTHLEFGKVLELLKSGASFKDAKSQAQKEVLAALGISENGIGNSEELDIFSSPVLLAVSVLLQGNRLAADVLGLLSDFARQIKDSGALSAATKSDIDNGRAGIDMGRVRENILSMEPTANVQGIENIVKPSSSSRGSSSSGGRSSSSSATGSSIIHGTPVDYEGETYETVVIGGQTWMARNLNYNAEGSKCYNDKPANCVEYGRLYDWATAMTVCPEGWHLPGVEWDALMVAAGGSSTAGAKLKGGYWFGESNRTGEFDHTDEFGFSALPGGCENDKCGLWGYWWGAGENAFRWKMSAASSYVERENGYYGYYSKDLSSVRCVQDIANPSSSSAQVVHGTPVTYEGETYETVVIGTQTWMARNLNYNTGGSKCYGEGYKGVSADSLAKNCAIYGRLYDWETAMAKSASSAANPSGVKGICPTGWHLPSVVELDVLMTAVGGSGYAGTKLRTTSGWSKDEGSWMDGNGTDEFGFAAQPIYYSWWSATRFTSGSNSSSPSFWEIEYHGTSVVQDYNSNSHLFSVRCVQD
jgi:uncharacterized protein (TIGR02145 family)